MLRSRRRSAAAARGGDASGLDDAGRGGHDLADGAKAAGRAHRQSSVRAAVRHKRGHALRQAAVARGSGPAGLQALWGVNESTAGGRADSARVCGHASAQQQGAGRQSQRHTTRPAHAHTHTHPNAYLLSIACVGLCKGSGQCCRVACGLRRRKGLCERLAWPAATSIASTRQRGADCLGGCRGAVAAAGEVLGQLLRVLSNASGGGCRAGGRRCWGAGGRAGGCSCVVGCRAGSG
jgi:hypothetical protein